MWWPYSLLAASVVELHRRVLTSSLDLARGVVHTQASSVQAVFSSLCLSHSMALACESHHRCSAILGDGQRVWFVSTCNRSITGCSFSLQDEESSIVFRGGSRGVLQRFVGRRSSDLTFCDGVLESSIPVSWWCRLVYLHRKYLFLLSCSFPPRQSGSFSSRLYLGQGWLYLNSLRYGVPCSSFAMVSFNLCGGLDCGKELDALAP